MIRRVGRFVPPLLGALTLVLGTARDGAGQSLHLAELFAEQGRIEHARAEVLAWFEIRGAEATPEELQHGLWLRARLDSDYRRGEEELEDFVDRYPDGPFTARALAWLAASAADRADRARAAEFYGRVLRNFPESRTSMEARDWLSANGFPVPAEAPPPSVPTRMALAAADTLAAEIAPALDTLATEVAPAQDTTAVEEAAAADTVPSARPSPHAPKRSVRRGPVI